MLLNEQVCWSKLCFMLFCSRRVSNLSWRVFYQYFTWENKILRKLHKIKCVIHTSSIVRMIITCRTCSSNGRNKEFWSSCPSESSHLEKREYVGDTSEVLYEISHNWSQQWPEQAAESWLLKHGIMGLIPTQGIDVYVPCSVLWCPV
jgi:hypothetical protein